jgi:hypothetical protein
MDNSASDPAAVMAGIFLLVTIALTAKERPTIVNVYNHKPSDV